MCFYVYSVCFDDSKRADNRGDWAIVNRYTCVHVICIANYRRSKLWFFRLLLSRIWPRIMSLNGLIIWNNHLITYKLNVWYKRYCFDLDGILSRKLHWAWQNETSQCFSGLLFSLFLLSKNIIWIWNRYLLMINIYPKCRISAKNLQFQMCAKENRKYHILKGKTFNEKSQEFLRIRQIRSF